MICTNRLKRISLLCMAIIAAVFMTGCGQKHTSTSTLYNVETSYLKPSMASQAELSYFSKDLCVTGLEDYGLEKTHSEIAQGAGLFNLDSGEIPYAQNLYGRLYPASTTKILTAYIIVKDCNLDATTTISANAANQETDSSVCGLAEGDTFTIRDLLYGLMLPSGNDAAIALAEYCSGSEEAFVEQMNKEALMLGASQSHFVNSNGLPDQNHYTTVYDMYLIFQAALDYPEFIDLIQAQSHEVTYTNKAGETKNTTWWNTNRYISEKVEPPEGIQVIGGKTGTTYDAGYCLVLYSLNEQNERIVSIVFKADGKSNLYLLMNELLAGFA